MSDGVALFEAERPRLVALAYRMLGEKAAAEDVVQETWLRWQGADSVAIDNPAAWLHRVAARLAIDALRSARARREVYSGPWLPEPLLGGAEDRAFELAQECRLALLWAMERLSPEERAAFILREAFDADYAELATLLQKSEAACRQLVSRAAKRVRAARPRFAVPETDSAAMLARFAQACAAQDHHAVLELLAPDVVAFSDGGGRVRSFHRPLEGAAEVTQVFLATAAKRRGVSGLRMLRANGTPALAVLEGGEADMLLTLALDTLGRIDWIYVMRNPEKLPRRARIA